MLHVRKGDRILIPHLPSYGEVSIVEATENWRDGYHFEVLGGVGEFGHIFPVKRLKVFRNNNTHVPASLRSTFRNPCRFWRIDYLGADIEGLVQLSDANLSTSSIHVDRWQEKIVDVARDKLLSEALYEATVRFNSKAEWEWILTDALKRLNPNWEIERVGGKSEAKHGTDILARIPDIFGDGYLGVAIQVKDYRNVVGTSPLDQIRKAAIHWEESEINIVQLVLVLIGAKKTDNPSLVTAAQPADSKLPVRIIWTEDVKDMVYRSACHFLSENGD